MKDRVSFKFGGNICALARVIRIHIIGYKGQRSHGPVGFSNLCRVISLRCIYDELLR